MAQNYTKIAVTHDANLPYNSLTAEYGMGASFDAEEALAVARMFESMAGGTKNASMTVGFETDDAVIASRTMTCATVLNAQTFVLNGITFTAVSATGTAPNNYEFRSASADNIATALNCATAINACTDLAISGVVTATGAGATFIVYAAVAGYWGNSIGCYGSQATIAPTATATQLAGGTYHTGYGTACITSTTGVATDTLVINAISFAVSAGTAANKILVNASSSTLQAASAALAIRQSVSNGVTAAFSASAFGQWVELRALSRGAWANNINITESGSTFTVPAAFTNGADTTTTTFNYGQ